MSIAVFSVLLACLLVCHPLLKEALLWPGVELEQSVHDSEPRSSHAHQKLPARFRRKSQPTHHLLEDRQTQVWEGHGFFRLTYSSRVPILYWPWHDAKRVQYLLETIAGGERGFESGARRRRYQDDVAAERERPRWLGRCSRGYANRERMVGQGWCASIGNEE